MDSLLPKVVNVRVFPLKEMFEAYCEMDEISSELNVMLLPLTQSDKWLTSARILDMLTVTTTDTGLLFFKFRKRAISYDEYLTYLDELAELKDLDLEDMKYKMQTCGKPRNATLT